MVEEIDEPNLQRDYYLVCMSCRSYLKIGTKFSVLSDRFYCQKIMRFMFLHVAHKISIHNKHSLIGIIKSCEGGIKLTETVLDRIHVDANDKGIDNLSFFNRTEIALESFKVGLKKAGKEIETLTKEDMFITGFNMGVKEKLIGG